MTLYYVYDKDRRRYYLTDNANRKIAHFDTMETAAIVLRYLKGANMGEKERNKAVDAIRKFDATRDAKAGDDD